MGWKLFKETFNVLHFVHMSEDKRSVLIGSPYITDLAAVDTTSGAITHSQASPDFIKTYYPSILDADPEYLVRVIAKPDFFARSIPVYTEEGGKIVEKLCEEPGWPNVTHDGCLMYENTYATDKAAIVRRAKSSIQSAIKWGLKGIADQEKNIEKCRRQIEKDEADLAALNAEFPDIVVEEERVS